MEGLDGHEEGGGAPVEEGAPLWTVTFGDMMSLLLTFFILMYSMSELKVERFAVASESFREALGGTAKDTVENPVGLAPEEADPEALLQDPDPGEEARDAASDSTVVEGDGGAWLQAFIDAYTAMIARRLEEFIVDRDLEYTLSVHEERDGVYLRIQSGALFASGEATVLPDSRWIVEELADITREIDVRLIVAGHADNQPISSMRFPSNWELSAARSAGVARVMVERGQDPERIRVESFGEHKPVASNDTPSGRAQNRRVEIFYSRADIIAAAQGLVNAAGVDVEPAGSTEPDAAEDGASTETGDADVDAAPGGDGGH